MTFLTAHDRPRIARTSTPLRLSKRTPGTRTIRVALLGCGNVGSRLAQSLLEDRDRIRDTSAIDLELSRILVRNLSKRRPVPRGIITDRVDDILDDRPDVVVEVLGGLEPAASFILRALEAGIHVVTANKTLIAHQGSELHEAAQRAGVQLCYEASVCAAIPLLASLRHLQGDAISSVCGIVNGSTNYILTRMSENGCSLEIALDEARAKGFVEPDPSADLSGRDAAEKLVVLAGAISPAATDVSAVECEGIERVTDADILAARRLGFAIKLVAELNREAGGLALRVGPTLVPKTHRLAKVDYAANGVIVASKLGGSLYLEGAGAGPEPTTSAILGDILRAAAEPRNSAAQFRACRQTKGGSSRGPRTFGPRVHYVRITTRRENIRPTELLQSLRDHGVSVKEFEASGRTVRVLTHPAEIDPIRLAITACYAPTDRDVDVLLCPALAVDAAARSQEELDAAATQPPLIETRRTA